MMSQEGQKGWVAVTPIAAVAESLKGEDYVTVARALDQAAQEVGVHFVGGYSALVQKGFTKGGRHPFSSLPPFSLGAGGWVLGLK